MPVERRNRRGHEKDSLFLSEPPKTVIHKVYDCIVATDIMTVLTASVNLNV
jgi:hypothetical protein